MIIGHTVADETGTILAADDSVCDWMHRTRLELVGKSYLEITHPDDQQWNRRRVDTPPVNAPSIGLRKRYARPDQSTIWAAVTVSRLSIGPNDGRLLGTLRALTLSEPKRLWDTAQHERQMTRAREDAFGAFMGGNHAWSTVLELYLAEVEARRVDAATIAARASFSITMTERWLRVLKSEGLAEPVGSAGEYWQLTSTAVAQVEMLLSEQAGS